MLLKIFDAEFPYKLLFWATLPTRQDGGENREKAYLTRMKFEKWKKFQIKYNDKYLIKIWFYSFSDFVRAIR